MSKHKIFFINYGEIEFNSISAEESDRFNRIINKNDDPDIEEYLFDLITEGKYKDKIDTLDAGIIPTIVFLSFRTSWWIENLNDLGKKIDEARTEFEENAYNIIYSAIIKTQNCYKIEELRSKSLHELLFLMAVSEHIVGHQFLDTTKLKEHSTVNKPKERILDTLSKEVLTGLQDKLNQIEEADFDEYGNYIGAGALY